VRQDFNRRMEKLERNHAAAQQAAAYRNGPSGAEVMRGLLRPYAIDRLPGQSRAQTLARAAGISTSELKDLLSGRPVRQAPAEGCPTGEPVREEKKPGSVWSDGPIGSELPYKVPEITVEFWHSENGLPAGTSVNGPDGRLVWLDPPEGCQKGEPVSKGDEPGSGSGDGAIGLERASVPGEERHNESDREGEKSISAIPEPEPPGDLSVWAAIEKAFNTRTEPAG
jgi:hypothetical protein